MIKKAQKSDKISKKEFDDWYAITLKAFGKIWLVVFVVEMFLFFFFKPNEECSRLRYFWLFIVKPSGIQGIALLGVKLYSKCKKKYFRKIQLSLSTIFLVSVYCAAAIWIHTSVRLMTMLLMLPLIITTLYKSNILMWVQLAICVFIFVMYELYFYPNSPYLPPLNSLINISIFFGSVLVELALIQQVQAYVEIMERKADHDSMTGLYNHKAFYEELERDKNLYEKNGTSFILLVMDIDKFKNVNDTYGHALGDQVICRLAEILKQMKQMDFCARYGGEEFAVIMMGYTLQDAVAAAEELRKTFEASAFETKLGKKQFTISIGVAEYGENYREGDKLFQQADNLLYRAKETGRNRVCY